MSPRILVLLPALTVLAACEQGAVGASDPPLTDPSPAAGFEEAITEPTDGVANEVEAD